MDYQYSSDDDSVVITSHKMYSGRLPRVPERPESPEAEEEDIQSPTPTQRKPTKKRRAPPSDSEDNEDEEEIQEMTPPVTPQGHVKHGAWGKRGVAPMQLPTRFPGYPFPDVPIRDSEPDDSDDEEVRPRYVVFGGFDRDMGA
jgi:hypothetical protein